MIDLGGPVPPNHAWHDELFRGWSRDYPDPPPPIPPPGDGLLLRPGPLYPQDEEAAAPLLPGVQQNRGDRSSGYEALERARALDPANAPVTAFGNWQGPVTAMDWMQLTPIGLGTRVALGFASALTGRTLPGSPQAIQRAWNLRALRADIDDILAGTIEAGPHRGGIAFDPHEAGVTMENNPYDPRSGERRSGGAPDAGGFGGPVGFGGAGFDAGDIDGLDGGRGWR
ncbi:MAG: hypothetical protein J4F33_08935 [Alphaproteobacteria bacterium]|nr:hypothetical protein [Alphaproteobacteria bacterium]